MESKTIKIEIKEKKRPAPLKIILDKPKRRTIKTISAEGARTVDHVLVKNEIETVRKQ
jgi:hypothetical protein